MKFFNLSFLYLVFGRAVTIYDLHQIYNLCLLGIYMEENNYITFSGILSNDKRYTQLMEGDSSKAMFNIEQTCDKYISLILKREDLKQTPADPRNEPRKDKF